MPLRMNLIPFDIRFIPQYLLGLFTLLLTCLGPLFLPQATYAAATLANGHSTTDHIMANTVQQEAPGNTPFSHSLFFSDDFTNTLSIAVGDLNGDGALDIVAGNEAKANSVYLTNLDKGRGEFQPAVKLAGVEDTVDVALGDLNGDGALDIVAGNRAARNAIYFNNGDGNFKAPVYFGTAQEGTESIAIGDLDGDGDLDVVVGGKSGSAIFTNDGQGNLSASAGLGTSWTYSIALGDLNGDGDLDIVAANASAEHRIYFNNGAGLFPTEGSLPISEEDRFTFDGRISLAVGDLDGDSSLDLVFGYESTGTSQIVTYMNLDGQGNFVEGSRVDTSFGPAIALGDINGDGALDMIDTASNKVFLNNGVGGFNDTTTDTLSFAGLAGFLETVTVADMDSNGTLDIIGRNVILFNDGEATLLETTSYASGDGQTVIDTIRLGDMDGNGTLDIVTGAATIGGTLGAGNQLYFNDGLDNFLSAQWGNGLEETGAIAIGDLNGDGWLDIVSAAQDFSFFEAVHAVYYNDGQGNFLVDNRVVFGEQSPASAIVVGDLVGSDALDILMIYDYYFEPINIVLFRNDGEGQFTPLAVGSATLDDPSVALGDLENDGDLDIVVGNRQGQNLIYHNLGAGKFRQSNLGDGADDTTSIATGDFNGDGLLDIVVGNLNRHHALYLNDNNLNDSNGNFGVESLFGIGFEASSALSAGDLDGDGDLDIVSGNDGEPDRIYINDGTGHFGVVRSQGQTELTNAVVLGDMNQDGTLDIVTREYLVYFAPPRSRTGLSNSGPTIEVTTPIAAAHAPFYASPIILADSPIVIPYRLFDAEGDPVGSVVAFYSLNGGGEWLPAIATSDTSTTNLPTSPDGISYEYRWDTNASGIVGQSDNILLRLEAREQPRQPGTPGTYQYVKRTAGPYQWPAASDTTFPFRVRGTQVLVMQSTACPDGETVCPAEDAEVYRLRAGQRTDATPLADVAGSAYRTDAQGYLQGRDRLAINSDPLLADQLVALWPFTPTVAISFTDKVRFFQTSAPITEAGLGLTPADRSGVISLTVSPANVLALFDLDVSLEWDARSDGLFLSNLENAFKRASETLYDVSDGQIALGNVTVYQAKEEWISADIVIYANNSLRPRASMGGIVNRPLDETQGLNGNNIKNAYLPGQIRMGPSWDPFGQSQAELSQDWWNALAHELAHYLLFLPDNYLAVKENPRRLGTTDCQYSFMTNAYDAQYTEFLYGQSGNEGTNCDETIANALLTKRSDWATINHFYKVFQVPTEVLGGPDTLPLAVTRVDLITPTAHSVTPGSLAPPLAGRNYDLRNEANQVEAMRQAQAYLLKSGGASADAVNAIIALGSTGAGSDRIMVRGAHPGDRVCLFHTERAADTGVERSRRDCQVVSAGSTSIQLMESGTWQPSINVRPVSSTTLNITVTFGALTPAINAPTVQILPTYGEPTAPAAISPTLLTPAQLTQVAPGTFTASVTLASPAFEGFVRVTGPGANQEAIAQFYVAAGFGPNVTGGTGGGNQRPNTYANVRGYFANRRSMEAPAASGDGKMTVFNIDDLLGETNVTGIQVIPNLPELKPWLTPVGPGYRLTLSETTPLPLTVAFQYLQRDVPPGYEYALAIFYLADGASEWRCLQTGPSAAMGTAAAAGPCGSSVDQSDNLAVTPMAGPGIYALMATLEMAPLRAGWNLFTYPVPVTSTVENALASVAGRYSSIYVYDPEATDPAAIDSTADGSWRLQSREIVTGFEAYVNDLDWLKFGQSYWISATETITPYLAVPALAAAQQGQAASVEAAVSAIELPIGTFYGSISSDETSLLAADSPIQAWVVREGTLTFCGTAKIQPMAGEESPGQFAYKIHVQAKGPDLPDCAGPGDEIQFRLEGTLLTAEQPIYWSNHQPNYQSLVASGGGEMSIRLFLPLLVHNHSAAP